MRRRARARRQLRRAGTAVRELGAAVLGLERERERVVGLFLLLGQFPGDVVLGAEALAAFLERGEVAGRHHAGALAGGAWGGERAGDLGVGGVEEGGFVVGCGEGVGVGCGWGGQYCCNGMKNLWFFVETYLS